MMYAIDPNCGDQRVEAYPKTQALCPVCRCPVIPKCGSINVWHWAHQKQADCDTWSEPETLWHRSWKELVPPAMREVVIGPHRADIVTGDGLVVELQHSTISAEEIQARTAFYEHIIWIFDATGHSRPISDLHGLPTCRFEFHRRKGTYYIFRWRNPRRALPAVRPFFLDLGDELVFEVRRCYPKPFRGWGHLHYKDSFIRTWLNPKHPAVGRTLPASTLDFYPYDWPKGGRGVS